VKFFAKGMIAGKTGTVNPAVGHCERPEGAKQSPSFFENRRLLRRFAPRNDQPPTPLDLAVIYPDERRPQEIYIGRFFP
jgi:hypothetical protein